MEKKFALLIQILAIATWIDIYLEECFDGFYKDGDYWKPCSASCKTWSNASVWDSWQDHMFLNSSTQLWEYCPYGEYYDSTVESWRSWNGFWNNGWKYQDFCIEWPSDQALDLETVTWVSDWSSNTKKIESSQLNLPAVWRNYEYYVDPYSTQILELGTREFPYRSMRAVTSEIVNFHCHTPVDIKIYTKEAFMEEATVYYVNMSSVSISNHPDYVALGKNAMIIPTVVPQVGISEQSRFHLLNNTNLSISDVTSSADFSDIEKEIFASEFITVQLSRTSLTMENLDFYSESPTANDNQFFMYATYLHEKGITASKFWYLITFFSSSS